jgi:catechol 2,3-dioxygenase-like lactoylglutathione lyase family enzyme
MFRAAPAERAGHTLCPLCPLQVMLRVGDLDKSIKFYTGGWVYRVASSALVSCFVSGTGVYALGRRAWLNVL